MALLYRIDPDDIDPALTARVRARGVRASDVRINWAELMRYKRSFTERGLRIILRVKQEATTVFNKERTRFAAIDAGT